MAQSRNHDDDINEEMAAVEDTSTFVYRVDESYAQRWFRLSYLGKDGAYLLIQWKKDIVFLDYVIIFANAAS